MIVKKAIMDGYKLVNSNKNYPFWTDGKGVYFLVHEIKNADLDSFIIYDVDIPWAKDKKTVYCQSSIFRNADKDTFEALNYSFVKDKLNVWTMNGKIDNVDIKTFVVCDGGKVHIKDTAIDGKLFKIIRPMGYGKDKNNVYYYNGNDVKAYKPKIVTGALPGTFVSMDDGNFGYDENSVFYRNKKLKNANSKTWGLFEAGCWYSRDKKVYYGGDIIKEADAETFEPIGKLKTFAKDKNNYYNADRIISKEHFEKLKTEFENGVWLNRI
jgi:hypothetical protein